MHQKIHRIANRAIQLNERTGSKLQHVLNGQCSAPQQYRKWKLEIEQPLQHRAMNPALCTFTVLCGCLC